MMIDKISVCYHVTAESASCNIKRRWWRETAGRPNGIDIS